MTESPSSTATCPSISVAMCTYNGAQFLEQQLASIAGQTVLPTELVVCDDGSQDQTIALLEAFARQVSFPVRIVQNRSTLRPAQNFARCLSLCACDVIVLTDQDDVWFADRVEQTQKAFAANPALTFAFSDSPLIDQAGKDLGRTIYSSIPISASEREQLLLGVDLLPIALRYGVLYGTTMAVRANLRALFLPVPELWSHDQWIALTASAAGPSIRLSRPVTSYRQHAGQQVGTGNWTLQTHLGLARDHNAQHYDSELTRYRNAIAATKENPRLKQMLAPSLEVMLRFLEDRQVIRTKRVMALPLFLRLLFRGDYALYASRVRSPLKDFLQMIVPFR